MLSNKKIVVTGAASGIGAETAKVLKENGAVVIGLDINRPTGNVDEFIKVDISNPASIDTAVSKIPDGIGRTMQHRRPSPDQGQGTGDQGQFSRPAPSDGKNDRQTQ